MCVCACTCVCVHLYPYVCALEAQDDVRYFLHHSPLCSFFFAEPGATHKGWWPAGPGEAAVFSGLGLQGASDDGCWGLNCAHDCSASAL